MQTNGWTFGRIAATTALILATLAVVFMLYRLGGVVVFAILSIIFAAALRAPMLRLEERVRSRGTAILLLYLIILLVIIAGSYGFSYPLGAELAEAAVRFPQFYDSQIREWQASDVAWQQNLAGALPNITDIVETIGENGSQIAYQLAGVTYNLFNILLWLVAILTLTFYWLIDEDRFVRLWLSLMPVQQRTVARQVWFDIEWRVGLFVRSEAAQFIVTVTMLWGGLSVLGVPYPALWALYGGIAQLIPWIGIPLIFVPLLPLALVVPWLTTLVTAIWILIVGWTIEWGIEPWFGTRGIIHPIVSVVALMVLGEAVGIAGMLIALPLAATIQSLLDQLLQLRVAPRAMTEAATSTQVQSLRTRLHDLQQRLPDADDPEQRRRQEGLLARTAALIDEADRMLRQRASAPERRRMPRTQALQIPAIFSRNRQR